MARTDTEIREKLAQHQENLHLWRTGYLSPTEPDPQEREKVIIQLKAAIHTLQWVLGLTELC